MKCPACGAEVIQQAVYCHKCGERVDMTSDQFGPLESNRSETSDDADVEHNDEAGSQLPADRLKAAARARADNGRDPEEELWEGGFSPKAMVGAWAISALITIVLLAGWIVWVRNWIAWTALAVGLLLLWLYQIVRLFYRRWNFHYYLTSQRFIHETGILRRVTDRIELIDIDDITFEQGLFERFVGVGTIRITSSDRTHPELSLLGIDDVKQIAGLIDDVRRDERRRRGLHIESI